MKTCVLAILDGWGVGIDGAFNAISSANTPCWDRIIQNYPYALLNASEESVGLPKGQMGNSEVGHLNIGAGRVILQTLPRIDESYETGQVCAIPGLQNFIYTMHENTRVCHIIGLVSDGGVHSHIEHIIATIKLLSSQQISVWIHIILDGRDTSPTSGVSFVNRLSDLCSSIQHVRIATVMGRYYAMDRDTRWERTKIAYDALLGSAKVVASVERYLEESYANNVTDEFILPAKLSDYQGIQPGDGLFVLNFRADRVRQIANALTDPNFNAFATQPIAWCAKLGMVSYSASLDKNMEILFTKEEIKDTLSQVVADAGLSQLRIAETEKYAHVTFFFNGGTENQLQGEERILIPSPKVATYDLQPEMSAHEITSKLSEAIQDGLHNLIVVNYANADMVGHTGNNEATRKAVEVLDNCLEQLVQTTLSTNSILVITADHGNADIMFDDAGVCTSHTLNPVPFVVVSNAKLQLNANAGCLSDVAPTILELMHLPKPQLMTGESLVIYEA